MWSGCVLPLLGGHISTVRIDHPRCPYLLSWRPVAGQSGACIAGALLTLPMWCSLFASCCPGSCFRGVCASTQGFSDKLSSPGCPPPFIPAPSAAPSRRRSRLGGIIAFMGQWPARERKTGSSSNMHCASVPASGLMRIPHPEGRAALGRVLVRQHQQDSIVVSEWSPVTPTGTDCVSRFVMAA